MQLAGRLTHHNTIRIFDYGRTPDGVFYYAMEYIPGLSLWEMVREAGAVSPARSIHILKQVCESLEEAHGLGMVHRDIKPQNIMVCQRGGKSDVVKVLDFGLVKKIIDPDSMELTAPARIGGTPLYMAPERIESPHDIDARVDIYSLGAVAYYLVTGKQMFGYEDELDLLYKIVNVTPARPGEVADQGIPPELERLIMSCLEKDRDKRPATVQDIMAALDADEPWTDEAAEHWWVVQQTVTAK